MCCTVGWTDAMIALIGSKRGKAGVVYAFGLQKSELGRSSV
jgi:hypothetical protein